jgi:hypothetical protein
MLLFTSRIVGASAFAFACHTLKWPVHVWRPHLREYFGEDPLSAAMVECNRYM